MRGHRKRTTLIFGLALAAVATTATAAVIQTEGLRITVLGQVLPFKLPRDRVAPRRISFLAEAL